MSGIVKRSVSIRGHRTSYSLERPFHDELARIAAARGIALAALVGEIDQTRPRETNLSSALRLHVLENLKRDATGQAPPGLKA
ncbi:MAG TPA: ribbon-helix-helix domain-containing protein [Aquamicrobium sp.]|nr:ribbon-helix-helix domain-containing protein [Aquamicrobium sp.]